MKLQEYIDLGQKIGAYINHGKEIERRIGMGWSVFVMKSYPPLSLKRKVYNQCILPVLTYGSETDLLKPGTKASKCSKGNGDDNVWLT